MLEKADSPNYLVSHVACTTLWQVARACGYSSISELIHHNTDYIANTVLFKLRHPSSHGDVTRIVQALAKHSDKSSAGLLEDVGHEVLNALDFCHKDNALPFLKVLASIVVYLNTWFPAAPKMVLKRCIHLQSSSNIYIQTAVLSIIKHAVIPMSCYQDELLPVVHLLWQPLVARFQKDDWHLCAKAFEVVSSLAETSRDFIRERTLREVWPRLAKFLHSQHAVSKNKGKAYEITSAFKYQLVLLRQLGPISCQLEVQEQGIDLLASAVVPYLELLQPLKLQEAAIECIENLARCSADTVWYCVVMAHCTSETPWSPGPPLQPLPLRQTPCSENSNVLRVMAFLTSLDEQQE
uniref:TTI1 C-terminal TPR domain-containing protein n=1 Tax=Rhipicephalus zambeziensis TaxID=60191 RepID=A0A224Y855_9ACAR